jgi:hypothetical protein
LGVVEDEEDADFVELVEVHVGMEFDQVSKKNIPLFEKTAMRL